MQPMSRLRMETHVAVVRVNDLADKSFKILAANVIPVESMGEKKQTFYDTMSANTTNPDNMVGIVMFCITGQFNMFHPFVLGEYSDPQCIEMMRLNIRSSLEEINGLIRVLNNN
jgi:hypothetical protein